MSIGSAISSIIGSCRYSSPHGCCRFLTLHCFCHLILGLHSSHSMSRVRDQTEDIRESISRVLAYPAFGRERSLSKIVFVRKPFPHSPSHSLMSWKITSKLLHQLDRLQVVSRLFIILTGLRSLSPAQRHSLDLATHVCPRQQPVSGVLPTHIWPQPRIEVLYVQTCFGCCCEHTSHTFFHHSFSCQRAFPA